jgi:hypothetical protein
MRKDQIWIGTQPLFEPDPENEDPINERRLEAQIRKRLSDLTTVHRHLASVAETAIHLMDRGVHVPEVAEALGLPPVLKRPATASRGPWKIRAGSNMALIADLIEKAGKTGISEMRLVENLRAHGRLNTANEPRRAVHWAITNLAKRTKAVVRDPSPMKWRALNSLNHFR